MEKKNKTKNRGFVNPLYRGEWIHQEVAIKRIRRDINLKGNIVLEQSWLF